MPYRHKKTAFGERIAIKRKEILSGNGQIIVRGRTALPKRRARFVNFITETEVPFTFSKSRKVNQPFRQLTFLNCACDLFLTK